MAVKSCGDCGLCCKLMGVTALEKPAGKWCSHFTKNARCAVYDDRPRDCRVFNCTWLLTESLDERWKPSACGFLMHADAGRLIVECDGARPQAWRAAPYGPTLARWAAAGQEVLVFVGRRGFRLEATGAHTPVTRV